MKKQAAIILVLVIILVLSIAGCSSGPVTSGPTAVLTSTNITASTSNALSGVFENNYSSIKYTEEMSQSGPGSTSPSVITQTVWQKGNKERVETTSVGTPMTVIIDMEKQMEYSISNGKVTELDLSSPDASTGLLPDINQWEKYIMETLPTVTGNDTLDGKTCTIIEKKGTLKMWIWQEYGVPLQIVTTSSNPQGEITTNIRFYDYDFSDIPASQFELPAGTQAASP